MIRVGSLFSGIGGFELGLGQGFDVRWQVEKEVRPSWVLRRHWPNVKRYDDVREVRNPEPVDLLCGGFPCQDLSVAGSRAGLAGERSSLFFEFARLADELSPEWVFIENVPGLLSSNGGEDMGAILWTLGELGYGYAYRVFDSQYLGVAQRRRRVFIVGRSRGRCPAEVLFESEDLPWDSPPGRAKEEVSAGRTTRSDRYQGGDVVVHPVAIDEVQLTNPENRSNPQPGDPAPTLTKSSRLIAFHLGSSPGYEEGMAATLTGRQSDPGCVLQGAPRRFTPRECERLQGFPDDWTLYGMKGQKKVRISNNARYKALGNAVTVNVIRWIGRRILKVSGS